MISILETVGICEIQTKSTSGPEIRAIHGVRQDDIPPFETPCLRVLHLLLPLARDARDIVDDLPCAE